VTESSSAPALEMHGISKAFGGNWVLQDVDLELQGSEVHALVGENGAGKSTLMKILNGVYQRDRGSIQLSGREVEIASPHDARRAGISMIFQEHTLASHLTVAENIFLGVEPAGPGGILNNAETVRRAQEVLDRHGFALDARTRVSSLTTAEKQMVEIARALMSATRVVVMDEPTAMLSLRESEELFRIIRELRGKGLAVVYISHRMEELPQIADRVTILRDGKRVFTGELGSIDSAGVIRHMVGREIAQLYPPLPEPAAEVTLEVRNLSRGREYHDVSFDLRRGEILGLAGLVGAGRTQMARGIFGLEAPQSGTVKLDGRPAAFRSSREAIRAGLAYLSEDRKVTSVFPHLSLAHNISIAALEKIERGVRLNLQEETRIVRELISKLDIRARSQDQSIYRLSGGNQQKALIARWLFAGSRVLILDEPTQGVDLGARAEIYRLMREIVDQGGSILMISSDLPELLGMSHRIAVMRRGHLVATLDRAESTQEEIMKHAC
jgi:ABC-type sugar transport system ATPase subunit